MSAVAQSRGRQENDVNLSSNWLLQCLCAQPIDLKQISLSDIIENEREIVLLKKTLIHTNSNIYPLPLTVIKCGLCWLRVNCIVKFLHFSRFFSLSNYCAFLFYILFAFVFPKYASWLGRVISKDEYEMEKRLLGLCLQSILINLMMRGYYPLSQFTAQVLGTQWKFTFTTKAT